MLSYLASNRPRQLAGTPSAGAWMTRLVLPAVLALLTFPLLASTAAAQGAQLRDTPSFIAHLRARGLTVETVGAVQQPFLPGARSGTSLHISGGELAQPTHLQSYDYNTTPAAEADARRIGPNGQPTNPPMIIGWIGDPHFFRKDQVIVIYVGEDPAVVRLLTELLGPPFAQGVGGRLPPRPDQPTRPGRVAPRFAAFYDRYDGLRLLGSPLSPELVVNGYPAQYFEKGRLEDHQGESADPNWRFLYGLLVDELHHARVRLPIGGDESTLTYADLTRLADPASRVVPPAGYGGQGTWTVGADGTTFIPFTTDLTGAPGHWVWGGFWQYINRIDLFPGGWLHDVGLPISEAQEVRVTKYLPGGPVERTIRVQAFQRTILTYDPANPPEWQIERANVGTDYQKAFPDRVGS